MRLKKFEQPLRVMQVPLVKILAREMRLTFFEVDQAFEILRVPLVTILAREMRLKFFQVDQALEMLRVAIVTILAREMRLKILWSRPSFGDAYVGSGASHDIGARNAIEFFLSRPTVADVASGASNDIGARNAIEKIFKSTNVWRCCECR